MKTCNAQIEDVKELLNNISGLAIDYDCLSGEDSMKGLIDDMADWAREALAILEKLPRDSSDSYYEQLVKYLYEIRFEPDKLLCIIEGERQKIRLKDMELKNNADK